MEEIIKSTHEILKLANRFGWNTFYTDDLLTIFEFASQHELQLSLLPFDGMPDQFRLGAISPTTEQPTNVYFQPDRFGCLAATFTLLSETELAQDSLSEKVDQLEKRVTALEGKPQKASHSSPEGELLDADHLTLEEKLAPLNERAKKLDNYICLCDGCIVYRRPRRTHPNGRRWQVFFTTKDAYQPEREHRYSKWYFDEDELEALELTLKHDEELYRQAHEET